MSRPQSLRALTALGDGGLPSKAEMPAEVALMWDMGFGWAWIACKKSFSAIGLRQVLPVQTKVTKRSLNSLFIRDDYGDLKEACKGRFVGICGLNSVFRRRRTAE